MRVSVRSFIPGPLLFLVTFVLFSHIAFAQTAESKAPPASPSERAQAAAKAVASTYDKSTGLFSGTGWWNSANGITALADVTRDLQTPQFDAIFTNTFKMAPHKFPGFLNEFYDDEGWWALAWIDVYELRKDPQYLKMADFIFTDMTGGWSDSCGGGIWWKKNEHYKNAIANELFLSVAAKLASLSQGEAKARYLDWAQKEERWFLSSGMINSDNLVNDGLDSSCKNNHRDTWTYNQGVLLTGMSLLSGITGDKEALDTANRIATAVATHLTDKDGVIHDPCEPKCGEDAPQFKGIFMRNLVTLQRVSPSPQYTKLIQANADSIWTRARTESNQFSVNWAGPPQDSGTSSWISALDGLTAELSVAGQTSGSSLSK